MLNKYIVSVFILRFSAYLSTVSCVVGAYIFKLNLILCRCKPATLIFVYTATNTVSYSIFEGEENKVYTVSVSGGKVFTVTVVDENTVEIMEKAEV